MITTIKNSIRTALLVFFSIPFTASANQINVSVSFGVDEQGKVTKHWIEQDKDIKPLTAEQKEWAELIASRTTTWEASVDRIAVPFPTTQRPAQVNLVLGNRGGRDAFAYTSKFPNTIFFSLEVLARSYGSAKTLKNQQRVDRIFDHEYTHLLQHNWFLTHPYTIDSNFKVALNEAYVEGFGHYRSVSGKWRDENGKITPHALKTLDTLEKTFVERMTKLKTASDEEARVLFRGLAQGPFHKKWGALTVALWLIKEAEGDDKKLIKWVNAGPDGILKLADKYLSEQLKTTLNGA